MITTKLALSGTGRWSELAGRVLEGECPTEAEAISVLESGDDELLDVLAAAYRVRRLYFGNTVQFYVLANAKSGLCPEDCGYCSQSKVSDAAIPKYSMASADRIVEGARLAAERQAKTYCIVLSGRGPSEREVDAVTSVTREIKSRFPLKICVCLGLLTSEQAQRLKEAGVDRVNHNLNTSERNYANICSTHTYQDRLATLRAVRNAGIELCSGGIVGMGEKPLDVVQMAFELRALGVESIPINFLNPIEGTPLQGTWKLTPRDCLRVLSMFRFVNPNRELRIAGGREIHLRSLQPLGLFPANSIFLGDYLTTKGQSPEDDVRMIEDLGFVVTRHEECSA